MIPTDGQIPDELRLHDEITELRRIRGNHEIDESDYTAAILAIIAREKENATRKEHKTMSICLSCATSTPCKHFPDDQPFVSTAQRKLETETIHLPDGPVKVKEINTTTDMTTDLNKVKKVLADISSREDIIGWRSYEAAEQSLLQLEREIHEKFNEMCELRDRANALEERIRRYETKQRAADE